MNLKSVFVGAVLAWLYCRRSEAEVDAIIDDAVDEGAEIGATAATLAIADEATAEDGTEMSGPNRKMRRLRRRAALAADLDAAARRARARARRRRRARRAYSRRQRRRRGLSTADTARSAIGLLRAG